VSDLGAGYDADAGGGAGDHGHAEQEEADEADAATRERMERGLRACGRNLPTSLLSAPAPFVSRRERLVLVTLELSHLVDIGQVDKFNADLRRRLHDELLPRVVQENM
jgi:hypothetical protein